MIDKKILKICVLYNKNEILYEIHKIPVKQPQVKLNVFYVFVSNTLLL